jgi:probable phosphomutase (TIGR03848 family)
MTNVLLIRHGMTDAAGVSLAGRIAGVALNEAGRKQSEQLPDRLTNVELNAVYSSPLERAQRTAAPLAVARRLPLQTRPNLTELDFGEWTGRRIDTLSVDPTWQRFNSCRSGVRIPGGESMLDVQRRVVADLEALRRQHSGGTIAIVTHGDVIRAALVYYLGMPIDLCLRLDVLPASISVVTLGDWQPLVRLTNALGTLAPEQFTTP